MAKVAPKEVSYTTYQNMVDSVCSADQTIINNISHDRPNPLAPRLLHAAMGLCTEAGELLDQMKKHIVYGREFDRTNFIEELGDLQWYLTLAMNTLKISPHEVMAINYNKLAARYPGLVFSAEAEKNRDLDAERELLEGQTKPRNSPGPNYHQTGSDLDLSDINTINESDIDRTK